MSSPSRPEGLLRELAPQVLGAVVRRYGDFASAEDAVQEALVAAATDWPVDGVPDDPRAWLIRVASRRLIDQYRRDDARRRREDLAASWSTAAAEPEALYLGTEGAEAFEWARTVSRLHEMRSSDYIARPHGRGDSDASGNATGLVET